MKAVPPLFWHQGLLLQPQHFQQLEQHLWSQLLPRFAMAQPFFWGVRGLEVREGSLAQRVLEVVAGEFLFPDGTLARLPGDARLKPRAFGELLGGAGARLKAYVGLRRFRPEGPNVTVLEAPNGPERASARYVCDPGGQEVNDLHQEAPAVPVQRLEHALEIFWEPELPSLGEYELIPVAAVELNRGVPRLCPRFAAPVLQVGDSEALTQVLRAVRDQAQAYCRNLEETKDGRDGGVAAQLQLAALRVLARHLPLLHHHAEAPWVHPWALLGDLRQFAGELSTFSSRVDVLGRLADGRSLLREYEHADPLPSFLALQALIGELLEAILAGPQLIIELARDGARFQAALPQALLDSRQDLFLTIHTAAEPTPRLAELLLKLAKLGAPDQVQALVARALPGVPLEPRSAPPPGLARQPGAAHFRIDRQDPRWQEVQRSGSVCLHWDGAPEDTRAELVLARK
ncbi:MAG: type VI secretion system baseplate subunit TssK [Holophaga sp.]|nr:type VI secretion system baseplate subunit TssK [Holophaga sp.]